MNNFTNIKQMNLDELARLAGAIREQIIAVTHKNGGHLSSNLGAVELTIALHYVFCPDKDKFIWDVGHQSYTHKLLTDRAEKFSTLRQMDGISGFTKPDESPYDAFISGHSSTSISVACGFAASKLLSKEEDKVIAIIGDGALTGGLAYEGLNNARAFSNLIIILNDNKMSISRNVGALARCLNKIRNSRRYYGAKDILNSSIFRIRVVGGFAHRVKTMIKNFIYKGNIFEDLGFEYLGPVAGHKLDELITVFERARSLNKAVVVHVNTVKGKGFTPAEANPSAFHGIMPPENGDVAGKNTYSETFGEALVDIARKDDRIAAITASMRDSVGLAEFSALFPNRFWDVGIAEAHAVTFAASLSANGIIPVFACYSSFLQRAYDEIIHDAAIENRHIVLAVDRAGIVEHDGETHQGLFDLPMLMNIPGVTIYSPVTAAEMRGCLGNAIYNVKGIAVVRYPRDHVIEDIIQLDNYTYIIDNHRACKSVIVTYGRLFSIVERAARELNSADVNVAVCRLIKICPLDMQFINEICKFDCILVAEEQTASNGIGVRLRSVLAERGYAGKLSILGIDEDFVPVGGKTDLFNRYNLNVNGIKKAVSDLESSVRA